MQWHCTKRRAAKRMLLAVFQSNERNKKGKIDSGSWIWHLGINTVTHRTEMCATFAGLLACTHQCCEHNQAYSIFPLHSSIGFDSLRTQIWYTSQSGNEREKMQSERGNRTRASEQADKRIVKKAERKWNSIYWNCGWIACHAFTNVPYFSVNHRHTSTIIEGMHAHMQPNETQNYE